MATGHSNDDAIAVSHAALVCEDEVLALDTAGVRVLVFGGGVKDPTWDKVSLVMMDVAPVGLAMLIEDAENIELIEMAVENDTMLLLADCGKEELAVVDREVVGIIAVSDE